MDLYNFLTLVALGLSSYGVANIYSGKMLNNEGKQGKGIVSLLVGFLAVCWLNPIFPRSMFFSLLIMAVFAVITLGYVAHAFLEDKEVINVEIIEAEKKKPEVEKKPEEVICVDAEPEEELDINRQTLLRSNVKLPDHVPVVRKEK